MPVFRQAHFEPSLPILPVIRRSPYATARPHPHSPQPAIPPSPPTIGAAVYLYFDSVSYRPTADLMDHFPAPFIPPIRLSPTC